MALTVELSATGRAVTTRSKTYELTIHEPDRKPRKLHVRQASLRIGSADSCDLPLVDPSASRIHCEIALEAEGIRLRDLGSTNGTFAAGLRVVEAFLPDVISLRVGATNLELRALPELVEEALPTTDGFGALVGESPKMLSLFRTLARVASSDFTVLLQGESGTGKEVVAESIHAESGRKNGPFVVFDCAAIPAGLMESELFGHTKGAFTGASAARVGMMEQADGGTLFLDEIGELPLELQPKLLRALEKREVRPVGGDSARKVDVRIIAATHRELAGEVNAGRFREDLYYRLAVVRVAIPSLAERPSDLPLLVRHFLSRSLGAAEVDRILARLGSSGLERLKAHRWPGNVRELRNVVERLIVWGGDVNEVFDSTATTAALPEAALEASVEENAIETTAKIALDQPWLPQKAAIFDGIERRYFEELLARASGSITKAAQAAEIDRAYFRRMLKKYR
ncbi:MAG: sigma 54-interacting transcriptional regulator [Myxococcota bacterium]